MRDEPRPDRELGVPPAGGRRPLTRLATAGVAAHVGFELAAGVELPLASLLGRRGAIALWTAGTAATWHHAGRRSGRADTVFASANSLGLAAVVGHLLAWPTRRSRAGLPWLEDCEGLGAELMPYYNPILYISGVAAAAALLHENRAARRWPSVAALTLAPVLGRVQRWEHARLRTRAGARPDRWNRRLR